MTWKDVLKNIEFDPTESCCSELKNNYLEFVEKLSDYYESIGIYNNMRMHYLIADESCEQVLDSAKVFLEKMIDEFESCKDDNDKIKVPLLAKPTTTR